MTSKNMTGTGSGRLLLRDGIRQNYPDVLTPAALDALEALAGFNRERQRIMRERIERRAARFRDGRRIGFLESCRRHPAHRAHRAAGARGPVRRLGNSPRPAAAVGSRHRPRHPAARDGGGRNPQRRLRPVSGADGWMFDGEDALGQVDTMSFDNQRDLAIAFGRQEPFLRVAENVAVEMNAWAKGFFGRETIPDWKKQLDVTTRIFRPRGLHLDDRHVRDRDGSGFSASIVDAALYVVNNHQTLRGEGRSIVLYLPKIQTAEEAALWNEILAALSDTSNCPRRHKGLRAGRAARSLLPTDGDPGRTR